MNFDKHKELAQKYHVDDIASALVPSTSISNFLGELETSKISMMSRRFLAKNKFIALERFANGTINFDEYELLAKQEKVIRIQESLSANICDSSSSVILVENGLNIWHFIFVIPNVTT